MEDFVKDYIDRVNQIYSTGNYTELSFRGAFADLCQNILNRDLKRTKKRGIESYFNVINEPKRKEYGAPDYEIVKADTTLGFIEAKNIGDTDLRGRKATQHKKQFDRYKTAISTIAFTDYLSIILYEDGEEVLAGRIGIEKDGAIELESDKQVIDNFIEIILRLGAAKPQPVRSAKILAEKMANKAKLVADILRNAMSRPAKLQSDDDKDLWGKLNTFKQYLVHDMSENQFVDFYAQTILYGLFVARIHDTTPESFSLLEAADLIPGSNPFLKRIFRDLALAHPHPYVKGILEDLVLLFKVTKMDKVLRSYGKDPLVHFYEDFLAAYDPRIKNDFGVWYTPIEVVNFIVDSVDSILTNVFGIESGLANNERLESGKHRVQILDPATGTGTFLAAAAEKIYKKYQGQEGLWNNDVSQHIIPRLNGFEYLVAPYTMAHLKLAVALRMESAYDIPKRLNIFLTNSLEEDHPEAQLEFARYITDESNAASHIKRGTPIMVIMGNPPYNENSANTGAWIMNLMDDYKQEPGVAKVAKRTKSGLVTYRNTLTERNAKAINNDYCKFIRLGHNFISRNQEGVLAYICGNTFTKTNVFRGMRFRLLQDFDKIYIINLHGSSKFDEAGGAKDENIFNITVGVSINIFVKSKNDPKTGPLATVYYKDIFGSRKEKLSYLSSRTLNDIDFQSVVPQPPFYEFSVKDGGYDDLKQEYLRGFKLDTLMINPNQGFKTGRDPIAIRGSRAEVESLISDLVSDAPDSVVAEKYGFRDSRDWKLSQVRQSLRSSRDRDRYISPVCYRPFDQKWTYLHKDIVSRPRPLVQSSMMGKDNLILCVGKQGSAIGDNEWSLAWISTLPTDMNVNPRGGAYLFPLYLYDDSYTRRKFNLFQGVVDLLETKTGLKLQPADARQREQGGMLGTDIIDYIYAILHSTRFRRKYHTFLQNDFPVIPYPSDSEYFLKMVSLGEQLRKLHLLDGIKQSDVITQYPVAAGDDVVTQRRYEAIDPERGRVWINQYRYFDNVPLVAWAQFISGYQPLDKWLKDRMGSTLSGDDIRHFQKMVVALTDTSRVMAEIDTAIML